MSAGLASAEETPDNAELYRMILELKAGQQQLVDDAAKARAEAAQAREQLEATQKELEAAQQQLQTAEPAEPVAATPPVSAASEEGGLVRQANLARGLTPWGEFRMLRVTNNNQDFASLSTAPAGSTEILTTTNKIVQSNYDPSFDIGATWQAGGATDFTASFMAFHNKDDAKLFPPFESPDGNEYISLIATLAPPSYGQNADSAQADDSFKMQVFDAEVGQNLIVGEKLALRLSGGVRYAHLAEHFQAFYFGGDFSPIELGGARSNFDFDFWGVGPSIGIDGRYPLAWGFNVFGKLGVSILVGEKEAETGFTDPADDTDIMPLYFAHRDYGVQVFPAVEIRAGLGWEHGIGEWGKAFIDGGYEFQSYFNVVEQLTWGPPGFEAAVGESTGDLGIDGFFFRGGFRFFGP